MSTVPTQLRARFRGALLGLAIGDALGAPFEGAPVGAQADLQRLRVASRSREALRYTDDTHMAIGLAESLVACQGFDGAHLAHTWARNYAAEPWRGYGAGPPQVFRLLAEGVPWDHAAKQLFGGTGSFGNGAAMRVAPAALLAFRDLDHVTRLTRDTGRITHTHPLALEGAVLQAIAVARLLHWPADTPLDAPPFIVALFHHIALPRYLEQLGRVASLLAAGDGASPTHVVRTLGHGVAAAESVPAALYAFLRQPESFVDAVTGAIALGGDTDTIAAMTGALAGAWLGEESIPPEWRERVEGAAHLRALADALLALATRTNADTDQNGQGAQADQSAQADQANALERA